MNRTPIRNAIRTAAHSCAALPFALTRWMDRAGIGGVVEPVLQ